MPRRYGGYGGSGYGDLLDFAQQSGNASYNPMSPHPDWGGAIRQTIQMMLGMKQQREQEKQAKEQQMWERAQEEKKARIEQERYAAIEKRYKEQAIPEVIKTAKILMESDPVSYPANDPKSLNRALDVVQRAGKDAVEDMPMHPEMASAWGFTPEYWDGLPPKVKATLTEKYIQARSTEKPLSSIEAEANARARGAGTGKYAPQPTPKDKGVGTVLTDAKRIISGAIADVDKKLKSVPPMDDKGTPNIGIASPLQAKRAKLEDALSEIQGYFDNFMATGEPPDGPTMAHIMALKQSIYEGPVGGKLGQDLGGTKKAATAPVAVKQAPAIPPEILAEAKKRRPDLSEAEIIKRWLSSQGR